MKNQLYQMARAAKKAILGPGSIQVEGVWYRVAYEARGAWSESDYPFLKALSRGRTCIYDVGAYIGITALLMSRELKPGGRLLAFEPSAEAAVIIRENASLNGLADTISVINAFVGNLPGGLVEFFETGPSVYNSAHRERAFKPGAIRPVLKPTVTLDDVAASTRTLPDFVKIDVEGAELDVIDGMTQIIAGSRPEIFVEIHEIQGLDVASHAQAIIAKMTSHSYDLYWIKSGRKLAPSDLREIKGRTHALLIPSEKPYPENLRGIPTLHL